MHMRSRGPAADTHSLLEPPRCESLIAKRQLAVLKRICRLQSGQLGYLGREDLRTRRAGAAYDLLDLPFALIRDLIRWHDRYDASRV